jgi:hypothetical protein
MAGKRKIVIVLSVVAVMVALPLGAFAADRVRNDSGRQDIVTQLTARASDDQRELVADGVVTDSERLIALGNTEQCLRDAGVHVEMLPERGPGQFRFGGGTLEEQQKANIIYQDCYDRFQREVDMIHSVQGGPPGQ